MANGNDNANSAIQVINPGALITAAGAAGGSLSIPAPFENSIVLYEYIRIAGTTHIDGIDDIVAMLELGTKLRFERESDNLADSWAIKVYAGEDKLGYVPADCNELLARLMDGGKALSAKLIDKEKVGNWNKLHMEVSLDD